MAYVSLQLSFTGLKECEAVNKREIPTNAIPTSDYRRLFAIIVFRVKKFRLVNVEMVLFCWAEIGRHIRARIKCWSGYKL